MELKEMHEKIRMLRELADMNPNLIEPRIRAGIEGKIRNAQSQLLPLEDSYKEKVANDCVIIATKGKYCKEFAIYAEKMKAVPVDFLLSVDLIGDSILNRGGKDRYSSNEHLMAMDELNKIKMNYKISQLPVFQAKFDGVPSGASIKKALYVQLTSQYAGQLYSAVTRGEIGKKALEAGFLGKRLPVVLYNYTIDLDPTIVPAPVAVIEVNERPTDVFVKKTLTEIRNKFKSNKAS